MGAIPVHQSIVNRTEHISIKRETRCEKPEFNIYDHQMVHFHFQLKIRHICNRADALRTSEIDSHSRSSRCSARVVLHRWYALSPYSQCLPKLHLALCSCCYLPALLLSYTWYIAAARCLCYTTLCNTFIFTNRIQLLQQCSYCRGPGSPISAFPNGISPDHPRRILVLPFRRHLARKSPLPWPSTLPLRTLLFQLSRAISGTVGFQVMGSFNA